MKVWKSHSFKVLDLEGNVEVTLINGKSIKLNPGEMVIVLASGEAFEPVMTFNLGEVVSHLILVRGFSTPLPSLPLVEQAIQEQNQLIIDGKITDLVSPQFAEFGLELVIKLPNLGFPPELLNIPDHSSLYISPVK